MGKLPYPERPILGFTGTQDGMTTLQRKRAYKEAKIIHPSAGHHGDCIGADAQFHVIMCRLNVSIYKHPPKKKEKWANMRNFACSYRAKPYLDRNQDIVDAAQVLMATPKTKQEEHRSGTWFTVRRARKKAIPIVIILPSGKVRRENWEKKRK